ncbi:MAG: MarP family serine protease [Gaiellaceae bacterium]
MTRVDWIAVAVIAIAGFFGFRKGLLASALSLAGVVVGAYVGARVAPHILPGGDSPFTPLVGLGGAAVGAVLLETVGTMAGGSLRSALALPPLRTLDSLGGLGVGAAAGLALVWIGGAVALHLPGQREGRRAVQESLVLTELNRLVPPSRIMAAIERVDPFPSIAGPALPSQRPDPEVLARPGVGDAAPSVVRVLGTACGLAVSGSGWVARPQLVVTAAHVVAGQRDTTIELGAGSGERLRARTVAFDAKNDIAVLRVRGLRARPLPMTNPDAGESVAILGYPENGPFDATAARLGRTVSVIAENAYGRGPVRRTVTSLRGNVRHGNSGGPGVTAEGEVATTVFAARVGARGGYGVPPEIVEAALDRARGPVSTGRCA